MKPIKTNGRYFYSPRRYTNGSTEKEQRIAQARVIANIALGLQGSDPEVQEKHTNDLEAADTLQEIIDDALTQAHTQWKAEHDRDLNEAVKVIQNFVDDDECWFDHHGYCQTHFGGFAEDKRCPNQIAKDFISSLQDTEKEPHE